MASRRDYAEVFRGLSVSAIGADGSTDPVDRTYPTGGSKIAEFLLTAGHRDVFDLGNWVYVNLFDVGRGIARYSNARRVALFIDGNLWRE